MDTWHVYHMMCDGHYIPFWAECWNMLDTSKLRKKISGSTFYICIKNELGLGLLSINISNEKNKFVAIKPDRIWQVWCLKRKHPFSWIGAGGSHHRMSWSIRGCHSICATIWYEYWYLIGRGGSRDLNTGLWLVHCILTICATLI